MTLINGLVYYQAVIVVVMDSTRPPTLPQASFSSLAIQLKYHHKLND